MSYYETLIRNNDFSFLSSLIEKYHLNGIVDFLNAKANITIQSETGIPHIDNQKYSAAYGKAINTNSKIYGREVYYRIIENGTFIDEVANINPYLFARIIL